MNPTVREKKKRLHHLRRLVLETANRLIEANEAKTTSRVALLHDAIRRRDWQQAGQHCATLGRLVEIQVEAKRIRTKHSRRFPIK
jgi:HD superfamily phosphohydrolase YqeK